MHSGLAGRIPSLPGRSYCFVAVVTMTPGT